MADRKLDCHDGRGVERNDTESQEKDAGEERREKTAEKEEKQKKRRHSKSARKSQNNRKGDNLQAATGASSAL
jgi:hypothetical protein